MYREENNYFYVNESRNTFKKKNIIYKYEYRLIG